MSRAILTMTFGSPEEYTFEGIAEFFTHIRRGVRPSNQEIQHLFDNYAKIGESPLQVISKQQAALLQERVGDTAKVYFANKFSAPYIQEVIHQMERDGITECLCLILEPHYSYYSIMGYEKFLNSRQIKFKVVKEWYHQTALLDFWVQEISKIVTHEIGDDTYQVIFSAHSVPALALEFEDPYIDQILHNAHLIAERLGLSKQQYTNTWQSESEIGLPWIKPDVLEYLHETNHHPQHYIFVPISFISEHIEVLLDNDIECREACETLGVAYHRPPMPNNDRRLIEALWSVVQEHQAGPYEIYDPEAETFDEMELSGVSKEILTADATIQMPEFVKKLIEKKGKENVKMPLFVKKMLEKRQNEGLMSNKD